MRRISGARPGSPSSAGFLATAAQAQTAARRFRLSARHRSDHPAGHPLRRLEQFRRPQALGLRRGRMRGEARGRAGAESRSGRTGEAETVAEDVRLLPAGARARATWWCGRRTAGRRRPSGAITPRFRKKDLFRLGYIAERSQHSTGAALDLTLVDLAADNSATFDPAKDLCRLHRARSRPRAGRQRRHGHRL